MENRKLYAPVRIPTYEEVAAHIAILRDVGFFDDPVAESVHAWEGIGDGKRNTEKQVSVYDAMMAELHGDKARRAEKWRKTHDRCKKSKDDTPADRKRNKIRHMRKMYGRMWEDGKEWYWAYGREGRKQNTEPDAEILINLKIAEMEKSARADGTETYYADVFPEKRYVGSTTISGMINRLWKQMVELRKPYEDAGYECFENYYYRYFNGYRFMMNYTTEYYDVQSDYEYLVRWADVLAARKRGVALDELEKADAEYFCESGQRVFDRLMKQMHPEFDDEGWRDWREYEDRLDEEMNKRYWESLGELDAFLWDNSISQMGQEYDDLEDDWYE